MKIQPLDFEEALQPQTKIDQTVKLVFKSRFKRLFERPFSGVLKITSPEKQAGVNDNSNRDGSEEIFEPGTACLSKMVQNFMEDEHKCGRNRCNCFNGKCTDSSDDEEESYKSSITVACDVVKNLVPCLSVSERNLQADVSHLVEKNKMCKLKDEARTASLVDGLTGIGYKASICKSKWEHSATCPAGVHEYIEVVIDGERFITDIDFRSEFEIARSTKSYKLVLQMLPNIFVGKPDRLEKIIDIVSEAAKLSLKKKGMPLPPWRKADYMKAKWLSPSPSSNTTSNHKPQFMDSGKNHDADCGQCCLEFKPRILNTRNKNIFKVKTGLAYIMEDQLQSSIGVLTETS